MTIDEIFRDSNPPHLVGANDESLGSLRRHAKSKQWRVWDIDAAGFKDVASIYRYFSETMEFPVKGSDNWDALNDMLSDLDWVQAKGHLLIIHHADRFSDKHSADFAMFVDVLSSVGQHWHAWQDMKHPFKSIFLQPKKLPLLSELAVVSG